MKRGLILPILLILILGLIAFVSAEEIGIFNKTSSVCGNNICEEGESELIPILCTASIPPSCIYEMRCSEDCKIVKEQVKCIFINSDSAQKCYTDDGVFGCSGTGICVSNVSGDKGDKITWKSSCGGYAYTVLDGNNNHAEFKCSPKTNVTEEEISGKGFRFAYWECYDKISDKQGNKTSCKPFETWQKYAKEFCEGHCYEDGSKCGINSLSVSKNCYFGGEEEVSFISSAEEGGIEEKLICKDSCPLDGKCYQFGFRKSGNFCSDEGNFIAQLETDFICENNFECKSNVCVSGECISEGLIEKIINWFKRFFS